MKLPAFFDEVPRLRIYDPLAEMLGSAEDGILEYGYGDVVRAAGHSCPTVASAYWLTVRALTALYPNELPQRGGVRVEFREDPRGGVIGVAAMVVQMLTGAAGEGGFKGLAGRYARNGLQRFAPELPLTMRFTRLDRRSAVDVASDFSSLHEDARLPPLMAKCAGGRASDQELALLAELWQQRVRNLLLTHAWDPCMFVVRDARLPWGAPAPRPSALVPRLEFERRGTALTPEPCLTTATTCPSSIPAQAVPAQRSWPTTWP